MIHILFCLLSSLSNRCNGCSRHMLSLQLTSCTRRCIAALSGACVSACSCMLVSNAAAVLGERTARAQRHTESIKTCPLLTLEWILLCLQVPTLLVVVAGAHQVQRHGAVPVAAAAAQCCLPHLGSRRHPPLAAGLRQQPQVGVVVALL
jgi:hypothetical protein